MRKRAARRFGSRFIGVNRLLMRGVKATDTRKYRKKTEDIRFLEYDAVSAMVLAG
jgi:hypothetical protein